MDVPAGWVLQPPDPFTNAIINQLVVEASDGAVEGYLSETYAEPGSVARDLIPTTLGVSAATTELSLEEFAAFEFEMVMILADLYGVGIRHTVSSPATLGPHPGMASEYVVDAAPAGSFTIRTITTVVDGMAYSVTYTTTDDGYADGLVHLERAARSFEAAPAGEPALQVVPAGPGEVQPGMPHVSLRPGITQGVVTGVVDGDTLDISGARYRLNLVDTPERGEPGFAEAADEVERLCPAGSIIYYDGDDLTPTDRYGRHLGVVWCGGNDYSMSVGEHLWLSGLAEFYFEFCRTSEAATIQWAAVHGRFYHDMCSG